MTWNKVAEDLGYPNTRTPPQVVLIKSSGMWNITAGASKVVNAARKEVKFSNSYPSCGAQLLYFLLWFCDGQPCHRKTHTKSKLATYEESAQGVLSTAATL